MMISQVQQWNLHVLDELVEPSKEPLHLTSLKGGLECVLGSWGILVTSWSPSSTRPPFSCPGCSFRRDPDDVQSLDCASLPPLPCLSKAEPNPPLSFSLLLYLLFLPSSLLDISLPPGSIPSVAPPWPTILCEISPATAGTGPSYDFPPSPLPEPASV